MYWLLTESEFVRDGHFVNFAKLSCSLKKILMIFQYVGVLPSIDEPPNPRMQEAKRHICDINP